MQGHSQYPDKALEDRLRSLILNNSDNDGRDGPLPVGQPHGYQHPSSTTMHSAASLDSALTGDQAPTGPRQRGKRPNQAQRRQMSAQLSIPVDPRAQHVPSQPVRPYVSPPAYSHPHSSGMQPKPQRPHSATFQPPYQFHGIPNQPLTGTPFSSQVRHHQSLSYHGPTSPPGQPDWRYMQGHGGDPRVLGHPAQIPFDAPSPPRTKNPNATLYNPGRPNPISPEELQAQAALLEDLCNTIVANAEIEPREIVEKEAFRVRIEEICRTAISQYEIFQNGQRQFPQMSVQLRCFGSLSSGFATKASDMDLGLLSPLSLAPPDAPGSPIPRLVEKAFLDAGLGSRLLSKTRVPIIKLCEKPPEKLRLRLLDARVQWERGLPTDLDGPEDEGQDEPTPSPVVEEFQQEERDADHHLSQDAGKTPAGSESYERKLALVKQSDLQLATYYGKAKKLLRQVGHCDITKSNADDFRPEDYKVLNEFCLAFVRGLADDELKHRLLQYESLSEHNLTALGHRRSLFGVFTQAEGEKLAILWDTRKIREKSDLEEQHASNRIRIWKDLQNNSTPRQDPVFYNKRLHHEAEQLAKIPSIQVMILAQYPYESAREYHARTIRLLLDLGSADAPSEDNWILPVVIRQFVHGIYKQEIRKQVEEFAQSTGARTLRAVARRHKSLQLAAEFTKVIQKGDYSNELKEDIKAYIANLRGPMRQPPSPNDHFDFVVPVSRETQELVARIRTVSDPSKAAGNQPRDPYRDPLEFPKTGAGVQCDINFSAHLALQNTLLLRCYSHTDLRVRPLVLFVKHWAKVRGINTPYRGTLSSYGYVLMVLHYLVNIVQPFVCPNLQELARPPAANLTPEQFEETVQCRGRNVQFWRDEAEIQHLARENRLNQNRDSVGALLRGFFEYYAQSGPMSAAPCRGFDWGRDVLSLRTHGGLLTKQNKGWTGARTVIEVQSKGVTGPPPPATASPPAEVRSPGGLATWDGDGVRSPSASGQTSTTPSVSGVPVPAADNRSREVKEVKYRYLFAIEDPFELDHNVARTVTHAGIVAIRDEFRRANRIIRAAGKGSAGVGPGGGLGRGERKGGEQDEDLLADVAAVDTSMEAAQFVELLDELHGKEIFED